MAAAFPLVLLLALALQAGGTAPGPADQTQTSTSPPVDGRRTPGRQPTYPEAVLQTNRDAVEAPPPESFPVDQVPLTDRWRLIETLGVHSRWFDPYRQNTLKGDRPILGTSDWFMVLSGLSDSVLEPRSFPVPVGVQTTSQPGSLDTFGRSGSLVASQTLLGRCWTVVTGDLNY